MPLRPATVIDLRSDTVTQPTAEMRQAMGQARVGDDVYSEDPTVNYLQEKTAEVFAREASLFLPSGTMANQIALKIYTQPGQDVICEQRSHIYNCESEMLGVFSGCTPCPIWANDGILTWNLIAPYVLKATGGYGGTGLITLENTSNFAGGTVFSPEALDEVCLQAHTRSLTVYLDGARIFNAAVALGISVDKVTQNVDSLMFSLSKGLGAPAGSMLVGSSHLIAEARRFRKMLGGGMRQVGILAAAALLALREGPGRLHEDHENAQVLAHGLAQVTGLRVSPEKVVTNIVLIDTSQSNFTASELASRFKVQGVLMNVIGPDLLRAVTHRDVVRAECEQAVDLVHCVMDSKAGEGVVHHAR